MGRCIRFLPKIASLTAVNPGLGGASGSAPVFGLASDLPNPIRPGQMVRFSLSRAAQTSLELYDAQGRMVRHLLSGCLVPGQHTVAWDGTNDAARPVPSGWYFYRLASGDRMESRKVLLAR
jgi:hypothetical protein